MERFNVVPQGMFNRAVRGQFLYSPVVAVRGSDLALIYVAGQTAVLPDGKIAGVGDLRTQIRVVCEKVREALESVGATLDDVVRTVTYVLDIDDYYSCVEERYKYFSSNALPTNTLIAVKRLASPEMLVEIEAEAVIDPKLLRIPAKF